ncbi:Dehydrogenase/reductase SDR family member 4 [Porphyridium purpureum]|uniref:Dehydrogenase/reductase SDR family member 4 n=1 Tax=Porphyridium purpureum TaxID=35688 RepID=A0A5J4YX45_PORPP|nr:Dehydrogenase/reductase SDR family member 4 [Porphyridium purpureum]|eukprot:POR4673..scf227_4
MPVEHESATQAHTPRRFVDKVVLVTGSTAGIGFAAAEQFVREGAQAVFVVSRKQANVDAAVAALERVAAAASESYARSRIVGKACNVGDRHAMQQLLEQVEREYARLDVLILNVAANPLFGPLLDAANESGPSEKAWDKLFEVNVKSTFYLAHDAAKLLRNARAGSVVVVGSIAGYDALPALGAYSITKTALLSLTRTLAVELAPRVRVNCCAPGIVMTRFSEALWRTNENHASGAVAHSGSDERHESSPAANSIPLNRYAEPSEIAKAIAFLASSDASYITGETLVVAGGMRSRL